MDCKVNSLRDVYKRQAYAYANFHQEFMRGKVTLIGCPKLDAVDYSEKLTEIIRSNDIKSCLLYTSIRRYSYNKIVVFIDRSPAECYNSFRVLWIVEALLPQRRFLGGSNHSFFVEMLIS